MALRGIGSQVKRGEGMYPLDRIGRMVVELPDYSIGDRCAMASCGSQRYRLQGRPLSVHTSLR